MSETVDPSHSSVSNRYEVAVLPWLALVALVVAAPLACLKLPWLLPTVKAFLGTWSEFALDGSTKFVEDRDARFTRLGIAIGLYIVGLAVLIGLSSIAAGWSKSIVLQRIVWFISLLVSVALPFIEASNVGPNTDLVYVVLTIYSPICIAMLSAAALTISFRTS